MFERKCWKQMYLIDVDLIFENLFIISAFSFLNLNIPDVSDLILLL